MISSTAAKQRCGWCQSHPLLLEYHDREWGVPVKDDQRQFEHLILETFQAGLSWLTILKKRAALREVFAEFDPIQVAQYTQHDIDMLLTDSRIIRSRRKIEAAINNARCFLEITAQFGSFYNFLVQFQPKNPHMYSTMAEIPAQTEFSALFASELKTRGFKFIGAITCYAHLQSVGIVNDHIESCFRFQEVEIMK